MQYKTVLTPPPDYLASLAAAKENMTDGNVTSSGKPSTSDLKCYVMFCNVSFESYPFVVSREFV